MRAISPQDCTAVEAGQANVIGCVRRTHKDLGLEASGFGAESWMEGFADAEVVGPAPGVDEEASGFWRRRRGCAASAGSSDALQRSESEAAKNRALNQLNGRGLSLPGVMTGKKFTGGGRSRASKRGNI